MRNRSQDRGAPRLLMEFNRDQQVPKLVTLQEASRGKDVRNKLLMQARTQIQPHPSRKTQTRFQITNLHQSLNEQRKQKQQLRQAIRQLTSDLHKLRQINEGLIGRVKEVQSSYRSLKTDMQKQAQEQKRRNKNTIYSDIEEYIKTVVEKLTITLKQERMTPTLENKLQRFLAELMEINSVTVQQYVRRSRIQSVTIKADPTPLLPGESRASAIAGRYVSDYRTKQSKENQLPSREHYASIMQRLGGQDNMSRSYAVTSHPYNSSSHDTKIRTVYATTPSKRKRIFE